MSDITLTIKGLFGHFDYTIPLCGIHELDGIQVSDGVTILTGPNGYGKTTILRCLKALSDGDLGFFFNLNFQELSLHNDEFEQDLTIQKADGKLLISEQEVPFSDWNNYQELWRKMQKTLGLPSQLLDNSIERASDILLLKAAFNNSLNKIQVSNTLKSNLQKLAFGYSQLTQLSEQKDIVSEYPDWYESVSELKNLVNDITQLEKVAVLLLFVHSYIGTASLIREQRLLQISEITFERNGQQVQAQKVTEAVVNLPGMLKNHFSEASEKYSKADAALSVSFPARVLKQTGTIEEDEFKRRYGEMNEKLGVLQENGFSEFGQQEIPEFQADKGGVLRVFFDDFDQKYKEYEPLMKKLTLFRQIIDRRFRRFKRMEISREYGLRVRDIQTGEGGEPVPGHEIPLEQLSSGEKETLVLYYQLLFETKPDTMLLIDEPEISMHMVWQRVFIDELEEIVKLNKLRAVVATHSASIIGNHWDIQVDLGALYQDGITGHETGASSE